MKALRRASSEPVLVPNLVTSARTAVNSFKHAALRNWTIENRSEVCQFTSVDCSLSCS